VTFDEGSTTPAEAREAVHRLASLAGAMGIRDAQIALDGIAVLDEQLTVADRLAEQLEQELREATHGG